MFRKILVGMFLAMLATYVPAHAGMFDGQSEQEVGKTIKIASMLKVYSFYCDGVVSETAKKMIIKVIDERTEDTMAIIRLWDAKRISEGTVSFCANVEQA